MKLEPLKQWICDTCGEIIEKPEDGYLQWRRNENMEIEDFIIVHHKIATPLVDSKDGCYQKGYNSDSSLVEFIGDRGLVVLHSLADPGPYHMKEFHMFVKDVRKWLEIYKRLHLPYYEEARQYWQSAMQDGYFGDSNEVYIYLPENLRKMIEYYNQEGRY